MFILLYPRMLSVKNRLARLEPGDGVKAALLLVLGVLFWAFLFGLSHRVIEYFRTIEGLGDLLALRLLSMIFLTFFSLLVFSNIVTALSTFYLSGELDILQSAPIGVQMIYRAKFAETLMDSSWMTLIYGTPVFIAYGVAFRASFTYYIGLFATLVPFLIIPGALGIMITMLLVNAFPARRAKDVIVLLGLFFFVVLYILFRLMKPERLVDPDAFPSVVQYLTALRAPVSPFLPNAWATDALSPLLRGAKADSFFFIGMLWSTALASIVIGEWIAIRIHYQSWSKSLEGKKASISRSRSARRLFSLVTLPFRGNVHAIVMKDAKMFFRDTSQWSQLFLIFGLMVVYIYSFKLLPLDRAQMPSFFLQNLISFLNLGMTGFVTSAVAVRFVFPAVSLEGASFWIIRSAPITIKDFLWAKFWSSLIPLLLVSELMIIASNYLLKATPFMMTLGIVTVFIMTFGITSLGVGMGAMFPRFKHDNPAQIPSGFGGIVCMLVTLSYIGLVILLEAWPVYRLFLSQSMGHKITSTVWLKIYASFLAAMLVNFLAITLPLRIGTTRLSEKES